MNWIDMKVSDLIIDGSWNEPVCMTAFGLELANKVMCIPLPREITTDSIQWIGNKDGGFTVKEAHHVLPGTGEDDDDWRWL